MCHGYSHKAVTAPPKKEREHIKTSDRKKYSQQKWFLWFKRAQVQCMRFFVYPSHQMFAINRGNSPTATQALLLALSLRKTPPQKGLTLKS